MDPSRTSRASLSRSLEQGAALSGPERLVFVGLEQDRPWWAPLLAQYPGALVIEQPLDRGTGTGIIAATTQIFRRDPSARVLLLDCADAAGLELAWPSILETVLDSAPADDRIVLFGSGLVAPELGPGRSAPLRVGNLLFEMDPQLRQGWMDRGALVVMSPMVASVSALLSAGQATHPRTLQTFLSRLEEHGELSAILDELYPFCTEVDLYRDLLAGVWHQVWVRPIHSASSEAHSARPMMVPSDQASRMAPVARALAV
ncbi:MAG: hypothetical protein IPG45_32940 [Deltaproteobacteria bacterium]|nr:hypothetical protein [Deltaproteobacteria bacterium]